MVDVAARKPLAFSVPVHAGFRVREVLGTAEVEGIAIARPDGSEAMRIACDTIVLAVDAVPNVEMFDLLGCAMRFTPQAGGFVPVVDGAGRCSRAGVYAAGDCAGVSDARHGDASLAEAAGRRAAHAAGRDAGLATSTDAPAAEPAGVDRDAWRREWLQAHAAADAMTLVICRCEEVPLGDLMACGHHATSPMKP